MNKKTRPLFLITACCLLFATYSFSLDIRAIYINERNGDLVDFDLDFDRFEIKGTQAYLKDLKPGAEKDDQMDLGVRLPASITKSARSYPEIDFLGQSLEARIYNALTFFKAKPDKKEILFKATNKPVELRLASIEPVKKRGMRVANGVLWLDEEIAVKFSLMESKWSAEPSSWWIAFPAQYNKEEKRWRNVFHVKDWSFKKRITEIARKAYLERF
ncbi:hypothetical protein ACFL6Y_01575 [Elusimicrobiota bacterium]